MRARAKEYQYLYKTNRWKKLSLHVRIQEPKCRFCGEPSQVCDHIKPHKGNKQMFFDINNLMALCSRCHDSTKYRLEMGQIPGKDFVPNNEADDDGLPLASTHPWNTGD